MNNIKSLTVGLPKETKTAENRVALTPEAVRELTSNGIKVFVQTTAGEGSFISDAQYVEAGATIVPEAADAWAQQMVVKVKEPQQSEFAFLRPDLTLFTYLHLAAYPAVADALLASGVTSIAYETVKNPNGTLPLLAPMSEIAGRLAPQMAAHHMERHNGGRGLLFSGAPGVAPAQVTVIGAGVVGYNAARIAAGMGAHVVLMDKNIDRLRWVEETSISNVTTIASNKGTLEKYVAASDVVIGAVLVPGGTAPVVVTKEMITSMRRGSLVLDVAVDQGGCIETTKETTHLEPTYLVDGVLHYAVGTMPGAVPATATVALSNATLPYVSLLASRGVREAIANNSNLRPGLTTVGGSICQEDVAASLWCEYFPVEAALERL